MNTPWVKLLPFFSASSVAVDTALTAVTGSRELVLGILLVLVLVLVLVLLRVRVVVVVVMVGREEKGEEEEGGGDGSRKAAAGAARKARQRMGAGILILLGMSCELWVGVLGREGRGRRSQRCFRQRHSLFVTRQRQAHTRSAILLGE